ncbi:Alpha/beta hydrolase fold-1 [Mycena floridula]|nr:Alpha/beta hydrolase fold-1 [Mycena floridula]
MASSVSVVVSPFQFKYATSKCSLICIVKRYTPTFISESSNKGLSILIAFPGIGFTSDLWLPVIEHLCTLQNQPGCPIRIMSVWIMDRPNHGDAAVLNEEALNKFHSDSFLSQDYIAAIDTFLSLDLLSQPERENLVGLSHSSGAGPLLGALSLSGKLPFCSLVLIESPFLSGRVYSLHVASVKYFLAHAKQPESWGSLEEAMHYMRANFPWGNFDEANMEIIAKTFFTPIDPYAKSGPVKTKTPFKQQMVVWKDTDGAYAASDRFKLLMHRLPCHLIQGARHDPGIWPEAIFNDILMHIEETRPYLASVTTIQGVGHCLPHENPNATAATIIKALGADQPTSRM